MNPLRSLVEYEQFVFLLKSNIIPACDRPFVHPAQPAFSHRGNRGTADPKRKSSIIDVHTFRAEPLGSVEDHLPASQHEPPACIDERRGDLADQIFDRQDTQPRTPIPKMHFQHLRPAAVVGRDGLALRVQAEASETRVVMPASGAAWVWMERLKRDRMTIVNMAC